MYYRENISIYNRILAISIRRPSANGTVVTLVLVQLVITTIT